MTRLIAHLRALWLMLLFLDCDSPEDKALLARTGRKDKRVW